MDISQILTRYIVICGSSNNAIIRRTKIDRSSFYKILSGKRMPTQEQAERIIRAMMLPYREENQLRDLLMSLVVGEREWEDRKQVQLILQMLSEPELPAVTSMLGELQSGSEPTAAGVSQTNQMLLRFIHEALSSEEAVLDFFVDARKVEKHTAKYHIFSEKINMTAHVGGLWQANGDVLYQTNNHDVTDLAKGEDGRYAVKFTKPGEAVIRVYYRKNGEVYVQDFLFTILQGNGSSYAENKSNDSAASGASWTTDKGTSNSDSVYSESDKDVATFPEQVLQLVNKERAKVGARPLRLNDELLEGAKIRAEEISRHMSHDRPDGRSCFTVLRKQNRTLGENIAAGSATPEAVVDQWMHSPGHRANMLSRDFSELGVGYYYKDNSTYKHYWIQMFRG